MPASIKFALLTHVLITYEKVTAIAHLSVRHDLTIIFAKEL